MSRSITKRFAITLTACAAVSGCVPSSRPSIERPSPAAPQPVPQVSVRTPTPRVRAQPTTEFLNSIQRLGSSFAGDVGISVRDVDEGWTAAFNGDALLPQQSVSKLWVAITVMDAVDRGALSLGDRVTVRRTDLTLFHQPIRPLVGRDGYDTTIGALLEGAMTRSDNTCNDVLLWKVGGPPAVRRTLAAKGIVRVGFGPGERLLQAHTAGLDWKSEWAGGAGFLTARAKLSYEARARALRRYLDDPEDGASAQGVTRGLALLAQGRLLSAPSTAHLLSLMRASRTGPLRLRSGLPTGWTLAHKTGTGQDLGSLSTGYNDVGIVYAPNGHRYAVAVMIASTRQPIPARMRLMGDVTRALVRAVG